MMCKKLPCRSASVACTGVGPLPLRRTLHDLSMAARPWKKWEPPLLTRCEMESESMLTSMRGLVCAICMEPVRLRTSCERWASRAGASRVSARARGRLDQPAGEGGFHSSASRAAIPASPRAMEATAEGRAEAARTVVPLPPQVEMWQGT